VLGERRRDRFAAASGRLHAALRANAEAQRVRIARARERLDALAARAMVAIDTLLDRRAARLEHAAQLLTALSCHGVLARGFALVRSETGRPLRAAASVDAGSRIDIEFADGRVRATAEVRDLTGPPAARPACAGRGGAILIRGRGACSRPRRWLGYEAGGSGPVRGLPEKPSQPA
jgi:exodeoxyribonuclease VII large subunit